MARKLKVKKIKLSAEEKKIIEETIEENYSYYILNYALHTVMKVFMLEFKIKRQLENGKVKHINHELLSYGFPEWTEIINRTDGALERLFRIEDKEPLKNEKVIKVFELTHALFYRDLIKQFGKYIKNPCKEITEAFTLAFRIIACYDTIRDCIYSEKLKLNKKDKMYIKTLVTKFSKIRKKILEEAISVAEDSELKIA
jgi:hypothetical protein|nr:MAG TPA: hypothetical protein [Caudoviricetes sp.]